MRYEKGKEYPVYARKRGTLKAREEVLLNVNALAAGHEFYSVDNYAISLGQTLIAYAEDTAGRRQYTVRFKDLATGKDLADTLSNTGGSLAWAADDRTLFYVENDPTTLRSFRVRKHVLGTDRARDVTIYEEKDESYYTDVYTTGSDRYIVIHVSSTESDEARVLPADTPGGQFRLIAPRRRRFHYGADHLASKQERGSGRWIIRTDWDAPNYRLMQVGERDIGDRRKWQSLVPTSDKVFIADFAVFDNYLAIEERSKGLLRLRVKPWARGRSFHIASGEAAYVAHLDANPDPHTNKLRYGYSSLTTPDSIYEIDMASGRRKLLKRQPVLGRFDAKRYATERVWVRARDFATSGARIPVSLVYRKGFRRDGSAPLLQYGYGSYGSSMDPSFRLSVVSLLDRGFVYAIAHIRGGQEMGRAWYENGKKLRKKNTFNDFIDVTEALVREGYAAKDKVIMQGGSAGGLLVGAVANMRPDLYRGVIAHVPFVDVVTTMLDRNIPLTTNEFDEWGDPKSLAYYRYMLSYSPYDNVRRQAYPAMLVATGLHDSQVQYFEPAKWVAKLRTMKTDTNPLLLKVNMEAGHGGKSGRFQRIHEVAEEFAFALDLVGIKS